MAWFNKDATSVDGFPLLRVFQMPVFIVLIQGKHWPCRRISKTYLNQLIDEKSAKLKDKTTRLSPRERSQIASAKRSLKQLRHSLNPNNCIVEFHGEASVAKLNRHSKIWTLQGGRKRMLEDIERVKDPDEKEMLINAKEAAENSFERRCVTCMVKFTEETDPMSLGCDGCGFWVHRECHGCPTTPKVSEEDEEDNDDKFYCIFCRHLRRISLKGDMESIQEVAEKMNNNRKFEDFLMLEEIEQNEDQRRKRSQKELGAAKKKKQERYINIKSKGALPKRKPGCPPKIKKSEEITVKTQDEATTFSSEADDTTGKEMGLAKEGVQVINKTTRNLEEDQSGSATSLRDSPSPTEEQEKTKYSKSISC